MMDEQPKKTYRVGDGKTQIVNQPGSPPTYEMHYGESPLKPEPQEQPEKHEYTIKDALYEMAKNLEAGHFVGVAGYNPDGSLGGGGELICDEIDSPNGEVNPDRTFAGSGNWVGSNWSVGHPMGRQAVRFAPLNDFDGQIDNVDCRRLPDEEIMKDDPKAEARARSRRDVEQKRRDLRRRRK